MVYRGKPSTACGECRKRRSRCDQATPCGQCVKGGRICPGYRNAVDLMFQDESAKVVRKSKGRLPKPASTSTTRHDEIAVQRSAPVDLSNIVVYQPWDDLSVNFFMSNYIGPDPAVSQLHYLPTFYAKSGYAASSLKRTIIATGLAGYARAVGRFDLIEQSTRTYTAAIRDINTALSSTRATVNEATLMSIVTATMFETMLVTPGSGMQNVTRHLEGACSVAYLSLQHKEPSPIYRSLLSTVVQSVIMNCWIQHLPLPACWRQIRPYVPDRINPHSVHAKLVDILSRVIDFRSELREGSNQRPIAIIQRALQIDTELKTFFEEMPSHAVFEKCWMPTTQATETQRLVYNWVFHVYPQQFAGHLWNNVRSCRIHLHQVIHQQCMILLSSTSGSQHTKAHLQKSASESTTIVLAEEICATVPQLLSYSGYLDHFRNSTEHHLPTRTRSPVSSDSSAASSPPDPILPGSEHDSPNVSTPSTSPAPSTDSQFERSSPSKGNTPNPSISTSTIPPLIPHLDPASAYHMLLKLYDLTHITWLPASMVTWIRDRISWIEFHSDTYNVSRIREMVHQRPFDGFPVPNADGEIPPGGGICDTLAFAAVDQRLWFLAHSWLFVGLDWNADYYSNDKKKRPAQATAEHDVPTTNDNNPDKGVNTQGPTDQTLYKGDDKRATASEKPVWKEVGGGARLAWRDIMWPDGL